MNILIFGAGAIGSYVGGHLAQRGHKVTLISRSGADRLNGQGLTIVKKSGDPIVVQPQAVRSIRQAVQEADEKRIEYDFLLMTMKSYDVPDALNEMAAFYTNPPDIVTLQNGINAEIPIVEQLGTNHVIPGSITTPVSFDASYNVVEEKANRGIALSGFDSKGYKQARQVAGIFQKSGISTSVIKSYESLKWSKALLNMIGNATSAILNRHPGTLYRSNAIYELEMRMLREALTVMHVLNIDVINLPGTPSKTLVQAMKWLPKSILKPLLTYQIQRGRGDKMPSFQIDLANGRTRNEVYFHNGAVARVGREMRVLTPVNAILTDVLLKIADETYAWKHFDGKPKALLDIVNSYIREQRKTRAR
ncbi:MAG: 2-dehydropantoate 2-reductase [Chloroflexota bacterium]